MIATSAHITVGQFVRQRPSRTRILDNLGIDYCCGGKKPLEQALRDKGLDPATALQVLQAAEQAVPLGDSGDLSKMNMTQLIDHIEQAHHVYLKQELPRLRAMTAKVAGVHGDKAANLKELAQTVAAIADELFNHLGKEEQILFPSLRELESTGRMTHACFGTVRNPIRMMEHEHDNAAELLGRIRELAGGYTMPEWGCNTYRAMLDGLAQLEADTHQHIHKENNLLFPMAVEAEARVAGSL